LIVGAFALTQLLSFVYEVGTIGVHFAIAYALQRNCRYNACCLRVCGCSCCVFGLYAGPTDAARRDFLASTFAVTDAGVRLLELAATDASVR
jgi:hypothetical protein